MRTAMLKGRLIPSVFHLSLTLLALLVGAASVSALECVEYGDYIHQVGHCAIEEEPQALSVAGDLAYVLCNDEGVEVVDLSDPLHPHWIANIGNEMTKYVSADGDYAYVSWSNGLQVMDMSNPGSPVLAGQITGANSFGCSCRIGDHLFVWQSSVGLTVYDVSASSTPVLLTSLGEIPRVQAIAAGQDHLYLACGDEGVVVVDVSDPASLSHVTTLTTDMTAEGVDVAGSYLLLAERNDFTDAGRLRIFDISNPNAPAMVSSTDFSDYEVFDICHIGTMVFVAGRYGKLKVFDIADPVNPAFRGELPVRRYARWVEPHNGHIIVSNGDDYAFNGSSFVTCVDPGNGEFASVADYTLFEETITALAGCGELAYIGFGAEGLYIFSMSEGGFPLSLGYVPVAGFIREIEVVGAYAYLAADGAGLVIIDVADPDAPVLVASLPLPQEASCLVVDGGIAYVGGSNRFYSIDVSTPTAPILLGSGFGYGFIIRDIAYHDGAVYTSLAADWNDIFDVSDPANPIYHDGDFLGHTYGAKMIVKDDVLLFSGDWRGNYPDWAALFSMNVSVPLTINEMDDIYLGGSETESMTSAGDYVYFNGDGLHIVDVSAPSDLIAVGYLPINPNLLAATDSWLLMSGLDDQEFDPWLASAPLQCGSGTAVEEQTAPAVARLRSYPNPFNPTTKIGFDMPAPGRATLEIFDLSGRRVRRLLDEAVAAGPHERTWNGRDDAGNALASGVYLARFVGAVAVAESKLVLLK